MIDIFVCFFNNFVLMSLSLCLYVQANCSNEGQSKKTGGQCWPTRGRVFDRGLSTGQMSRSPGDNLLLRLQRGNRQAGRKWERIILEHFYNPDSFLNIYFFWPWLHHILRISFDELFYHRIDGCRGCMQPVPCCRVLHACCNSAWLEPTCSSFVTNSPERKR